MSVEKGGIDANRTVTMVLVRTLAAAILDGHSTLMAFIAMVLYKTLTQTSNSSNNNTCILLYQKWVVLFVMYMHVKFRRLECT